MILMSAENPGGWKLEDLLQQISLELEAKNKKIENDTSQTAELVRTNNNYIIGALSSARNAQLNSMQALDRIRTKTDPTDAPRIGS